MSPGSGVGHSTSSSSLVFRLSDKSQDGGPASEAQSKIDPPADADRITRTKDEIAGILNPKVLNQEYTVSHRLNKVKAIFREWEHSEGTDQRLAATARYRNNSEITAESLLDGSFAKKTVPGVADVQSKTGWNKKSKAVAVGVKITAVATKSIPGASAVFDGVGMGLSEYSDKYHFKDITEALTQAFNKKQEREPFIESFALALALIKMGMLGNREQGIIEQRIMNPRDNKMNPRDNKRKNTLDKTAQGIEEEREDEKKMAGKDTADAILALVFGRAFPDLPKKASKDTIASTVRKMPTEEKVEAALKYLCREQKIAFNKRMVACRPPTDERLDNLTSEVREVRKSISASHLNQNLGEEVVPDLAPAGGYSREETRAAHELVVGRRVKKNQAEATYKVLQKEANKISPGHRDKEKADAAADEAHERYKRKIRDLDKAEARPAYKAFLDESSESSGDNQTSFSPSLDLAIRTIKDDPTATSEHSRVDEAISKAQDASVAYLKKKKESDKAKTEYNRVKTKEAKAYYLEKKAKADKAKDVGRTLLDEARKAYEDNSSGEDSVAIETQPIKAYTEEEESDSSVNTDTLFALASHFVTNGGPEEGQEIAIECWTKAAKKGHAVAMFGLGSSYAIGEGVEKNLETAVKWWTKAAKSEEGHADAAYFLGEAYESGEGVEKNLETAAEWYAKAADNDHADLQYRLALMYASGEGVEENQETAVKWLAKAAKNDHPDAQYKLGALYYSGEGVEKNQETAVKWLTKAAESEDGHADAAWLLGEAYESGEGVEKNIVAAVRWYTEAVKKGNANAEFSLGLLYKSGKGVEKNLETAVMLWNRAAKKGDADAAYFLGKAYESGKGVEKNLETAAEWYAKAADNDHADPQYRLALMYASGEGVEENQETAVKWLAKAADNDHADAQCKLGALYYCGEGVEENQETAVKWLAKSAESEEGHADAAWLLGEMYESGEGVEKNITAAVRWYTEAVKKGNANAEFSLGLLYESGEGVEKNLETAVMLWNQAARKGHAEAKDKLNDYRDGIGENQMSDNARGKQRAQPVASASQPIDQAPTTEEDYANDLNAALSASRRSQRDDEMARAGLSGSAPVQAESALRGHDTESQCTLDNLTVEHSESASPEEEEYSDEDLNFQAVESGHAEARHNLNRIRDGIGSTETGDDEAARILLEAQGFLNSGATLYERGLLEEAFEKYGELERFEETKEPALRVIVAKALFNIGNVLCKRALWKDAIKTYKKVIRYCGVEAKEPALRDVVDKTESNLQTLYDLYDQQNGRKSTRGVSLERDYGIFFQPLFSWSNDELSDE